jgi:hypothetical protein
MLIPPPQQLLQYRNLSYTEGVRGLKDMGSKELSYKCMFYGSTIRPIYSAGQGGGAEGENAANAMERHADLTVEQRNKLQSIEEHVRPEGFHLTVEQRNKLQSIEEHVRMNDSVD